MRRLGTLAAVATLLFLVAAPAVAGPKGALTSAFHNEVNQFGTGGGVERPEGHISPFSGSVSICDDLVVGSWYSLLDPDRDVLGTITASFTLDGDLLNAVQTPDRRRSVDGESLWIYTRGVPVIGTLDVGTHILEVVIFEDGQPPFPVSVTIEVSSC